MPHALRDSRLTRAAAAAAACSLARACWRRSTMPQARRLPCCRPVPGPARPCCSPTGSARDARVAWLNPTAADAEPRRFWRLLMSALRECDGADRGLPVATPQGAAIDLVQMLFSTEPAAELVVIIDDAHVLTHPEVLAGLDRLIRAGQPGLRLVLAARSDPLLPLHRYRLAG